MKPFAIPEGWVNPSEQIINSLKGKGVTFQSFRFPRNVEKLEVVLKDGSPLIKENMIRVNDKDHIFISFLFVYTKSGERIPLSVPLGVLRPKLDIVPSEMDSATSEIVQTWTSSITSEIVQELDDFDGVQRFIALCAKQIKFKKGLVYLPIDAQILTGMYRKIDGKRAIRDNDGNLAMFPKQVYAIKFV